MFPFDKRKPSGEHLAHATTTVPQYLAHELLMHTHTNRKSVYQSLPTQDVNAKRNSPFQTTSGNAATNRGAWSTALPAVERSTYAPQFRWQRSMCGTIGYRGKPDQAAIHPSWTQPVVPAGNFTVHDLRLAHFCTEGGQEQVPSYFIDTMDPLRTNRDEKQVQHDLLTCL